MSAEARRFTLWRPLAGRGSEYWHVTDGHVELPDDHEVVHVTEHGVTSEATHEMHATLLRIAECEDLAEARQLARGGATWG